MHSSEILSVENGEVSRLLIESAGENSLLNERSKTLMAAAAKLQNTRPTDLHTLNNNSVH